jgi:hypothetical protein
VPASSAPWVIGRPPRGPPGRIEHSAAKSPSLVYVLLDRDDLLREVRLHRIKKFFGVRTHGEVRHQMLNGYRG